MGQAMAAADALDRTLVYMVLPTLWDEEPDTERGALFIALECEPEERAPFLCLAVVAASRG